jgi:hypothetical protein
MQRVLLLFFCVAAVGCGDTETIKETPVRAPTAEQELRLLEGLVGTWSGGCMVNLSEGMSGRLMTQLDADRTFVETTQIYLNTNCTGEPVDSAQTKGTFLISGVLTDINYEVDFQYADFVEDQAYYTRVRILQNSASKLSAKYRIFKYVDEGQLRSIPNDVLERAQDFDWIKSILAGK